MADTATPHIKFFDIEGIERAWSPNTWKTRFLLNYKRLPYTTEWVRYENIESNNEKLGVGRTHTEPPFYTLPLIVDETGSKPVAIVDSGPISEHIEKSYPDRPFATKDLLSHQEAHLAAIRQNVTFPLLPIIVPGAGKNFDEPTITFYDTTRPSIFGEQTMKDWSSPDNQDEFWAKLKTGLDNLEAYIKTLKHGDHSLFTDSSDVVYADCYLVSFFIWLKKAGPEGSWEKVRGLNGGLWQKAWDLCEPYMQVL